MKGLELAENYYNAVGVPMIQERFPDYMDRIAVGLVGLGSECFGFDDEFSRDHDWGPGFCMWLAKNEFDTIGLSLQQAYDALPGRFLGYQRKKSAWGDGRLGALDTGDFYRSFIGLPKAPERYDEWLAIPEANLAACTNGKVFHDPLGEFSDIRNKIKAYYPEDVRLKKIAARCLTAARAGQYNYKRCLRRGAVYPAYHALMRFCEDALRLVFLINKQFMPFYKWSCRAAETLPILGAYMAQSVTEVIKTGAQTHRENKIEQMCARIIQALKDQGLSDADSDFLLDHGPRVHSLIQDGGIKRIDMWWGGG
jgi:hypothetical protein